LASAVARLNRPRAGYSPRAKTWADETDVDPFDLKQVMWAMSVKVNPAGDIVILPNLSVLLLDPAGEPGGMVHKMIIDATTPIAPDIRGNYGHEVDTPQRTDAWREKLAALMKDSAPFPFDSKTPVKQMPLAWLRR
jgi:3-polyprenyl-4-hydroxybenzoate decarboxylase